MMVMFIGGFVGYSTYKNGWGVKGIIQTAMGQDSKKLENLDPFTVLIMGVSEDISVKLTDTIIVESFPPTKTTQVMMVEFLTQYVTSNSHPHQPLPHWHHGYSLFSALLIIRNQ